MHRHWRSDRASSSSTDRPRCLSETRRTIVEPVAFGPRAPELPETGKAVDAADFPIEPQHGHHTAKRAVRILVEGGGGFREPSRAERDALLVGFAMHRRVLYGAAIDAVHLVRPVDLTDAAAIASNMDAITIYEIKSTNRTTMKADLKGYFFNVTAAELLVAQSLGPQYRFAFVNVLTGEHQEMTLNEVFGRAKAMYPAWHIRF